MTTPAPPTPAAASAAPAPAAAAPAAPAANNWNTVGTKTMSQQAVIDLPDDKKPAAAAPAPAPPLELPATRPPTWTMPAPNLQQLPGWAAAGLSRSGTLIFTFSAPASPQLAPTWRPRHARSHAKSRGCPRTRGARASSILSIERSGQGGGILLNLGGLGGLPKTH